MGSSFQSMAIGGSIRLSIRRTQLQLIKHQHHLDFLLAQTAQRTVPKGLIPKSVPNANLQANLYNLWYQSILIFTQSQMHLLVKHHEHSIINLHSELNKLWYNLSLLCDYHLLIQIQQNISHSCINLKNKLQSKESRKLKRDLPKCHINIIHFGAPIPVDSHFVNLSHDSKVFQPHISPHQYPCMKSNTFYSQFPATNNNRNHSTSISLQVTQSNNTQITNRNITHNITANSNTRCNTTPITHNADQTTEANDNNHINTNSNSHNNSHKHKETNTNQTVISFDLSCCNLYINDTNVPSTNITTPTNTTGPKPQRQQLPRRRRQQQQQHQQQQQRTTTDNNNNNNSHTRKETKNKRQKPKHLETETVINLATADLTNDEKSLLSHGLNFCPTPNNIDWNELNTDLTDFKRRLRLKHFFHDKNEQDNTETDDDNENEGADETTHRYKKTSTWTPPKNLDPALDSYIHNIERDITNIQPTKISDNLTTQERDALQKLTTRTDIVIKPADKGSGTVVMDKQLYIDECNRQLTDTKFYEKHDNDITNKVTRTVTRYLEQMKQNKDIDKDTYSYLLPKDPRCSRFYILPKIHKNRQTPPGRPIVSATGHPTERISEYVSNILNPLVFKLPSFIKDTTHFLNKLSSLDNLPNNSLLVSLDVSSLYTNIPHSEGIQAAREHLNKRTTQRPPTETICDLINIILQNNNFEFDGQFFLQKHGTAMGTRMAPSYANLFMGSLEATALENAPYKPLVWWRFIDDNFLIWTHGQDKLTDFITTLNHIHPTIKFTNETSATSINFLDVTDILNNDNSISTDLYVKPTDTHQYLLSSSAHPRHSKQSIPYSLTLRLRRNCSNDMTFKKRTNELLTYLTNRGCKRKHIRNEIRKASTTTRQDSLKTKQKRHNNRTPFVVTYNPCLP